MIYFFYPSKLLGGAELLLLRTAYLLADTGLQVSIIDIRNGWLSQNVQNININIKYVSLKKIQLHDDDVLITPASMLYKIDDFFQRSNAKVILWVLQGYNVIMSTPASLKSIPILDFLFTRYINKRKKNHIINLTKIIAKKSIVSMDDACEKILFKEYNLNYSQVLPVYIELNNAVFNNTATRTIKDTISCVWLGRIDLDFKIHILKKLLSDIEIQQRTSNLSFTFNIIGNGPGLHSLKSFCEENISFNIIFLGQLEEDQLTNSLKMNDIGFAMGTSALNIASLSIPTVLLDFSYSEVGYYQYRWLFESENYNLGRDIDLLDSQDFNKMHSIASIIQDVTIDTEILKHKSYQHVHNNHSPQHIHNKLMKLISESSLTINDCYDYRSSKPFWVYCSSLMLKTGLKS